MGVSRLGQKEEGLEGSGLLNREGGSASERGKQWIEGGGRGGGLRAIRGGKKRERETAIKQYDTAAKEEWELSYLIVSRCESMDMRWRGRKTRV